jgi:hypothetical protein
MSSGLTGYLLSDGTDLSNVFMNINKGASLSLANKFTSTNTFKGNIDLSGGFLYGRNDGYNFTTVISAPYPIGYTFTYSNTYALGVSGAKVNYTPTLALTNGVWIVSAQLQPTNISSWNGYAPYIQIALDTIPAGLIRPPLVGTVLPIPKNSTTTNPCTSFLWTAVITAQCQIQYQLYVAYVTATTNTATFSGGMTKIA